MANAIGAALGTVGSMSDRIENLLEIMEQLSKEGEELEKRARKVVYERRDEC